MNILHRLLSYRKPHPTSALMSIETAHNIVRDYAEFMESSTPLPGCVADVKRLPHPKQRIKDAIGISLKTAINESLVDELKCGYLMLSAWQTGVGDQTLGLDFTRLNLNEDPILLAEKIQRHSSKIELWKPMIETDLERLRQEFEEMLSRTV